MFRILVIPDISRVDEHFNAFCIFTPVQSVNHYFFQFHTHFQETRMIVSKIINPRLLAHSLVIEEVISSNLCLIPRHNLRP